MIHCRTKYHKFQRDIVYTLLMYQWLSMNQSNKGTPRKRQIRSKEQSFQWDKNCIGSLSLY